MNKSMEITVKKLKGKSIIAPIFFFVFSIFGSLLATVVICCAVMWAVLYGQYDSSTATTRKIISRIEEEKGAGKSYSDILDTIQKEEKRPLSISVVDEGRNYLAGYGEKIDLDKANILSIDEETTDLVSIEVTNNAKVEDAARTMHINVVKLMSEFMKARKGVDSQEKFDELMEEILYTYKYWIESSKAESVDSIYVKHELVITAKEMFELFVVSCIMFGIFVLTCIGRLVNTISNICSQRYYLKMLLADPVTGGNNEFAFDYHAFKRISSIFNKNRGYAIVDLSLNKYQNYCTLYGVEEGEILLNYIDKYFKKNLQNGETLSHISGGDFFLLLRTGNTVTDEKSITLRARVLIERLQDYLATVYSGSKVYQGVSNIQFRAGLYYLPPVTDDDSKNRRNREFLSIKNLCIKAGIAKSALTEDGGLVVYNHEMWEKEIWERKVEDNMQAALDNEEFQVYIQPKYHPSTEELKGGEALVRWISPTEGFISPGQFIPIFERTGFVTKLDDYMISHTAKLQADWLAAGKKIVPISVNVSRAHFAQADLAEHIRDLVDKYPLPHKYIEIELTESAFFDDKKALLSTVHRLQEYGFEVSMDDFGSGYSSLNSLKDLPLNVLKLDAEFFRGDDFDGRGEIVVSEAISLAKKLDMRIVAEGVEKKDQVDFLAKQNCDMIQGYYFAKPMPAGEYEERMGTNSQDANDSVE